MKKQLSRYCWIAAVALALVTAGVSYAHPSWASDLGLDFWNVASLQQKLARDRQLRIELDRVDDEVMRRIETKELVISELLKGKIDLLEAAAEFRALNAARPQTAYIVRTIYAAPTEDESVCLNVLSFVDAWVQAVPAHKPAADRLKAEFERLRRAGAVSLPAVTLSDEF